MMLYLKFEHGLLLEWKYYVLLDLMFEVYGGIWLLKLGGNYWVLKDFYLSARLN